MGQVIVRNLDDETIGALKSRAVMHGNSLEQELRGILAQAAKPGPKERLALAVYRPTAFVHGLVSHAG